jgi:hypothetical protein
MSAQSNPGRLRRPAVTAVVAVLAAAALVAALLARDPGPPVIRLAGAGAGDATAERSATLAGDDAMTTLPAWITFDFRLTDGARFAAGEATGWRMTPPGDLRAATEDLARELGMADPEPRSPWGDGSWVVGPEDGSGPSLWVGPEGDWSFSDPAGVPRFACVDPTPDPMPGATEAPRTEATPEPAPEADPAGGDVAAGPEPGRADQAVSDDVTMVDGPCEPQEPPRGVPDEAQAREEAARFFERLALPMAPAITDVHVDEYGAWVSGRLPLDGRPSDLYVSVAFGQDAMVTSASATLATPVDAGRYPTVDAEAAVARLGEHGAGLAARALPADAAAAAEAGTALDPDAPVSSDGLDDVLVDPVPEEEPSILPLPGPDGESEVVTVTLIDAEPTTLLTYDRDGVAWLLPGVRFRSDDGGEWQVLTVADEYLDAADDHADPSGGVTEPAPEPPDGAGEPGFPGTGEPGASEPGVSEPGSPGQGGTEPVPVDPVPGDDEVADLAEEVVGSSEDDAVGRIEEAGYVARVVERDGEAFIVTDDLRPDRINLWVEAGRVTRAEAY